MKLKLDHTLTPHLKESLTGMGLDVDTAEEEGLAELDDDRVAEAARVEERMLFTEDKRFVDIRHYPVGTHPGMVLFRCPSSPGIIQALVESFVRSCNLDDLRGCVVSVKPGKIRVRQPEAGN